MIPDGAVGLRFYFHCGWAIQVDTTFESKMLYGGETLYMFDPGEHREVYLSSMFYRRHDGRPLVASDLIDHFPPKDMSGLRFEHVRGDLAGAGLWMLGVDDAYPTPSWVLMAMMGSLSEGTIARCTIVCEEESDRDWALDVWRSIVRSNPPARRTPREGKA